jgi:hypothetical protein
MMTDRQLLWRPDGEASDSAPIGMRNIAGSSSELGDLRFTVDTLRKTPSAVSRI